MKIHKYIFLFLAISTSSTTYGAAHGDNEDPRSHDYSHPAPRDDAPEPRVRLNLDECRVDDGMPVSDGSIAGDAPEPRVAFSLGILSHLIGGLETLGSLMTNTAILATCVDMQFDQTKKFGLKYRYNEYNPMRRQDCKERLDNLSRLDVPHWNRQFWEVRVDVLQRMLHVFDIGASHAVITKKYFDYLFKPVQEMVRRLEKKYDLFVAEMGVS